MPKSSQLRGGWESAMTAEFDDINHNFLKAGMNTILKVATVSAPDFVAKIPDRNSGDWDHFLRRRRLRAVSEAIRQDLDDSELERRLTRVPPPT